jgi:hypothetical protein
MKKTKPIDVVHGKENNKESQTHLEENAQSFGEKCLKVYDLLKSGVRLTVENALVKHGISSLPRRILDLKERGAKGIKDEWVKNKDGKNIYKQWYMQGTAAIPEVKKEKPAKKNKPTIRANPLFGGIV